MKCKYKKFLKAAYIDYEEDYCSNAVLRDNRPPLSEILAPATFELTLSAGEGYYWTTFYTSMANYQAPEGVTVYKEYLEGNAITSSAVDDRIINKRQGVVLRSSTSNITLTKTYSISSDNYSDNSLLGTDYEITNPGYAYVLGYKSSRGIRFYKLSNTGKIKANKAYLIIPVTYLTQWQIVGNSEVHTLPYPDGVVLPNGYKRCKYLEFHGVEYIDSGIIPEQGIEVKIKYLPNTDAGVIFGTRSSAWSRDSLYILRTGTPRMYNVSYGGKVTDDMSPVVEEVEASINSQSAKLNNTTMPVTSTIIKGQKNLYIGGINGLNLSYCYNGKIYFFKLSLNGADIFNGIPCLDDNNVPCLYDTVSGTSFYNDGTGTFGYELYPQPTEIWSCGEYNATDGKYHILVQPQGGSIADIALTEPLRKVNDVADTIEFPSGTEGKALVTRNLASVDMGSFAWDMVQIGSSGYFRFRTQSISSTAKGAPNNQSAPNALIAMYDAISSDEVYYKNTGFTIGSNGILLGYDPDYNQSDSTAAFKTAMDGVELIYELATPTTELVDAPQIEEADSYSMVISQGGKAVSWSNFETE